ncbi:MAG TPA: hypothetical protein VLF09_01670 [Cellvibrio sp.]|nr:hypothetical protein [Cellvibrio sp.]
MAIDTRLADTTFIALLQRNLCEQFGRKRLRCAPAGIGKSTRFRRGAAVGLAAEWTLVICQGR